MYIINNNNAEIIPVDFNLFFENACEYNFKNRYMKEYVITERFVDDLQSILSNNKENKIYLVDMKNVCSYPVRLLSRLENYLSNIIFYNISTEANIKDKIDEDLIQLKWFSDIIASSEDIDINTINEIIEDSAYESRDYCINTIMKRYVSCCDSPDILLESSGLYSNCYVNIKPLFKNVMDFYFIIFSLAEKIYKKMDDVDAFVTSSKNGAIIANVLGMLLDVKEVHLIGVGPKYSMELGDTIECIKAKKKYVYIFDFMCTGTEYKIVRALLKSKKANLVYSAGIAKFNNISEFNNIDVLTDTEKMNLNYIIIGK